MKGISKIKGSVLEFYTQLDDLELAVEKALERDGLEFLEANKALLKGSRTVRLCGDLLANLEWIADKTSGNLHVAVNVPKLNTYRGRRLQPRLSELKYWGFVEPGHGAGFWSITQAGVDFLNGKSRAAVSLRVCNDEVIERDIGGRWNFPSALNAATR